MSQVSRQSPQGPQSPTSERRIRTAHYRPYRDLEYDFSDQSASDFPSEANGVRRWTQEEDAIIFSAVKDYSNRDEAVDWNLVSRSLPGRSAGSAKLRWSRNLRGLRQTATRQPSDDEEDAAELMLLLKTAKYSPTPSGEENPSSQTSAGSSTPPSPSKVPCYPPAVLNMMAHHSYLDPEDVAESMQFDLMTIPVL